MMKAIEREVREYIDLILSELTFPEDVDLDERVDVVCNELALGEYMIYYQEAKAFFEKIEEDGYTVYDALELTYPVFGLPDNELTHAVQTIYMYACEYGLVEQVLTKGLED